MEEKKSDEMKKKKSDEMKKKNIFFIGVIGVLLLIILVMGIYIMYDKKVIFNSKNSETKKKAVVKEILKDNDDKNDISDDNDDATVSKSNIDNNVLKSFDVSKCLNCSGNNYTLSFYENASGLSAKVSQDKKSASININWNLFGTNVLGMAPNGTTGAPMYTITNFSKEIADVYIGGFGQSSSGTVILFLMTDGSVEYVPVRKAVSQDQVRSYGNIDGVSDVVKFLTADTTGAVTTLAMKIDGSFYDLGSILNSTGNF